MVRLSKTQQQFAIYQDADTGMPTPPADSEPSLDDTRRSAGNEEDVFGEKVNRYGGLGEDAGLEDVRESVETNNIMPTDTETDGRRESAVTSTSISSLPESSFETDMERSLSTHKPYSSPMVRPSFRRPESVRRMQMSSPAPFERTPRRQMLHSKPRAGTPRSVRSSARGSPLPRRRHEEEGAEEEKKEYPLVLLHVTLLPVELRWSVESMQEILPPFVLENLQLLRSKVSEAILQRGILIPHPREEYELLEERLLEALELQKERISKCGHFRGRESTDSTSSAEDSVRSGDSGMGLSIDLSCKDSCPTCHHRVKSTDSGVGKGTQKWSINVFAANGLMRSSAWAAAWCEMERVDIEILPWIEEDLRKKLDARHTEEEAEARREEEEAHIRQVVEEQVRIAHAERKRIDAEERLRRVEEDFKQASAADEPILEARYGNFAEPEPQGKKSPAVNDLGSDLPQVYRPKDIPISLLLKNYLLLLAQDKKNIAIFLLSVLIFWLSLRITATTPKPNMSRTFQMPEETTRNETLGHVYSMMEDASDVVVEIAGVESAGVSGNHEDAESMPEREVEAAFLAEDRNQSAADYVSMKPELAAIIDSVSEMTKPSDGTDDRSEDAKSDDFAMSRTKSEPGEAETADPLSSQEAELCMNPDSSAMLFGYH